MPSLQYERFCTKNIYSLQSRRTNGVGFVNYAYMPEEGSGILGASQHHPCVNLVAVLEVVTCRNQGGEYTAMRIGWVQTVLIKKRGARSISQNPSHVPV